MTTNNPLGMGLLLALIAGCEHEASSLDDLTERMHDEQITQVDIWCECWTNYDYASRNECIADNPGPGPAEQRCIDDALGRDETAARPWLECHVKLEEEYTSCLDQRLVCTEDGGDGEDACWNDYSVGRDRCIELPASIQRALDDCAPEFED